MAVNLSHIAGFNNPPLVHDPDDPLAGRIKHDPDDPLAGRINHDPDDPLGGRIKHDPDDPLAGRIKHDPDDPLAGRMKHDPDDPLAGRMKHDPHANAGHGPPSDTIHGLPPGILPGHQDTKPHLPLWNMSIPGLDTPDNTFKPGRGSHPIDRFNTDKCDNKCSHDATCQFFHNQYQCVCANTMQPQSLGGTCDDAGQPQNNVTAPDMRVHNSSSVLHRDQIQNIFDHPERNTSSSPENAPIQRDPDWRVLQIALPIGVFLFLFFVVILLFLRKWRQSRNSKRGSDGVVKNSDNVQLLERMNIISKNPTYFTSLNDGTEGKELYVREIPLEHLQLVDVVGEGAFGQVFKGNLFNAETNCETKVAVKVLKEGVCSEIREDFEREVEIMSAFDHDNILRLIGVVTQNVGDCPYMVFEYMEYGDLAELLRKNDPILRKTDDCIVLQKNDLIDMSTQVAKGMAYLTSQHFVHRDLATRNCLVGEGLVVKISDFGMSRDIYTCDYYKIGGSRMLPVRWMSPESVKYGRFTSESDVWAYGVVLWEIFSCGRQPYYGHSNEEVIRFLDERIYLQRPEDCPNVVYNIMLGCWRQEPKERFTFEKIHNLLEESSKKVVLTDVEEKSIDAASITEVVT